MVDLPAPLRPVRAIACPDHTSSEKSFTMATGPYDLVIFETLSTQVRCFAMVLHSLIWPRLVHPRCAPRGRLTP